MKTAKYFSVLSLALIFIGLTAGFSQKVNTLFSQNLKPASIKYQVIIHPEFDGAQPCGTYVVKVVDETGRLVAREQLYVPGINEYFFTEKVFAIVKVEGRRVAILEEVRSLDPSVCANTLSTLPDVKIGPFFIGQTYTFNLYPKTLSGSTGTTP